MNPSTTQNAKNASAAARPGCSAHQVKRAFTPSPRAGPSSRQTSKNRKPIQPSPLTTIANSGNRSSSTLPRRKSSSLSRISCRLLGGRGGSFDNKEGRLRADEGEVGRLFVAHFLLRIGPRPVLEAFDPIQQGAEIGRYFGNYPLTTFMRSSRAKSRSAAFRRPGASSGSRTRPGRSVDAWG